MAPFSGRSRWMPARVAGPVAAVLMAASGPATAQTQPAPERVRVDAPLPEPDPVVKAAVALLKDAALLRVFVVDPATLHVKTTRAGFRLSQGDQVSPNIYVNARSEMYQAARSGNTCALKSLAAVLAHEDAHARTKDERVTSRAEIAVLDGFLADLSLGFSERVCLMERRNAVKMYGGLK